MKNIKFITINTESVFFLLVTLWYFLIVHFGFYHSVSKKGLTLDYHVIIHGIVFSLWMILFAFQIGLIAVNKRKIHSKLGVLSLLIVVVLVPTGIYTIFGIIPKKEYPFQEVGTDLVLLSAFLFFYIKGYKNRKQPICHKRDMFFATMALTSAAIPRIVVFGIDGNKLMQIILLLFPIAILFIYDIIFNKKVYKTNIYNLIFFVGSIQILKFVWKTEYWKNMANSIYDFIY